MEKDTYRTDLPSYTTSTSLCDCHMHVVIMFASVTPFLALGLRLVSRKPRACFSRSPPSPIPNIIIVIIAQGTAENTLTCHYAHTCTQNHSAIHDAGPGSPSGREVPGGRRGSPSKWEHPRRCRHCSHSMPCQHSSHGKHDKRPAKPPYRLSCRRPLPPLSVIGGCETRGMNRTRDWSLDKPA